MLHTHRPYLLPVIYGEKKRKALGRVLREVVAGSGDISALDLPADNTLYKAPPHTVLSLSKDVIQTSISWPRHVIALNLVLKLCALLENLNAPRFANCRSHLPCIAFCVIAVHLKTRRHTKSRADGLHDLLITTTYYTNILVCSSVQSLSRAF